jgi:hypothetical protein
MNSMANFFFISFIGLFLIWLLEKSAGTHLVPGGVVLLVLFLMILTKVLGVSEGGG